MITVRVDDLAFYEGEAIARPVNAELGATTALLRRLEVAAGEALQRQLRLTEPLAVGSAVVTGAGALGVELLVHAVVSSDVFQRIRDELGNLVSLLSASPPPLRRTPHVFTLQVDGYEARYSVDAERRAVVLLEVTRN